MAIIVFKTLKKHNVVIVKQPFIHVEKHKSGVKKGKMKKKRQIQYVEHLDSIYIDEQKSIEDNPKPTPIYLKKGVITIDDEENTQKIEALRLHPDNEANGGRLFKEVNIEQEEIYEIQRFEALDKARTSIMTAEENVLRAAAVFFLHPSYLKKTSSTIKIRLREAVEAASLKKNDPTHFMLKINNFFAEKTNNEKLTVTLALHEGIILLTEGKKIVWTDSKDAIYIAGQAKDVIKDFATWLKTDEEGRQTLSAIADKIEQLNK